MNDRDSNNLLFLMSLSTSDLKRWYTQASEDDRLYAEELLAQGLELTKFEAVDAVVANLPHYPEANKVLAQFRL